MKWKKQRTRFLSGYYKPSIATTIDEWEEHWSMGPHAGKGWVWFDSGSYTDKQIWNKLHYPKKDDLYYTREED